MYQLQAAALFRFLSLLQKLADRSYDETQRRLELMGDIGEEIYLGFGLGYLMAFWTRSKRTFLRNI